MNKARLSFLQILLMFGLIPLITCSLALSTVSFFTVSNELESETYQKLEISAIALAEHYKEIGVDIENKDYTFVDELKEKHIEQSIFLGDKCAITSIVNDKGERIEGTKADTSIYNVVKNGKPYTAENIAINGKEYFVHYEPLRDEQGEIIGMAFAGEEMKFVKEAEVKMASTTSVTAAAFVLIFTITIIFVTRVVCKPLVGVANEITRMADGDLSPIAHIHSIAKETIAIIDSAGTLNKNVNSIVSDIRFANDSLDENIKMVDTETDHIAASSQQISTTVNELAEASQSMATNIQDIGEAVSTVDVEITAMQNNTTELRENADTVGTETDKAMSILEEVVEGSKVSFSAAENITSQAEQMSTTVQGIRSVLEMIREVAEQTKLLSLNASIEAARAGEAGRGFAVVATEIQKLSEQSNQGVEQIETLASDMLEQASLSLELSKDMKDKMSAEQDMLDNMNTIFNSLNELIKSVVEDVNQVDASVKQVNESKEIIVSSVQELGAISEENAASTEEVAAAMETVSVSMQDIAGRVTDIANLNDTLRDAVSKFKVE